MKAKMLELRRKSVSEIDTMVKEEKARLADLRYKSQSGEVKNTGEFVQLRKHIARLLTVRREVQK